MKLTDPVILNKLLQQAISEQIAMRKEFENTIDQLEKRVIAAESRVVAAEAMASKQQDETLKIMAGYGFWNRLKFVLFG